ncbi:AAR2 homolog, putative [Babesia ovata]|uniref:AAR2 homolog, putative n=1 Tax=Babesia ovata TaxID=189622 RepID=A0A2H6KDN9_9APIC|nr:AAR2 homolog, putative [Babesia ovata]GBE61113.1 AAR2 homolog, putative [Babesia ovata]
MDVDEPDVVPPGVNLTACLVLNQRDDECLGFDFVSFPGGNEVMGVIDLTPGAHLVYVKDGEPNEEVDRRLGEFVYIEQGKCTVLKRSKLDDGPLFEFVSEEEARGYHSGVIAGHFHGKLARIPSQLRNLWFDLTQFISVDVIRLLRPIVKPSSQSISTQPITGTPVHDDPPHRPGSSSAASEKSQGVQPYAEDEQEPTSVKDAFTQEPTSDGFQPTMDVDDTTNSSGDSSLNHGSRAEPIIATPSTGLPDTACPSTNATCLSTGDDDDDTAANYKEISERLKSLKGKPGLLCETFGITGNDRLAPASAPTAENKLRPNRPKRDTDYKYNTGNAPADCASAADRCDSALDWEVPRDQCTIYYSDLQKLNRRMNSSKLAIASKITEMHLDTTHILDAIVEYHHGRDSVLSLTTTEATNSKLSEMQGAEEPTDVDSKYACVLGEYEYAFCVFMLNFHYTSFEHWKSLFRTFCSAESFYLLNTKLSEHLLKVIKLQLETFESDLYEPDNFFAYHLSSLEEIINDNQPQLAYLVDPFNAISETFKLKFGISFEEAKSLQDGIQYVDSSLLPTVVDASR